MENGKLEAYFKTKMIDLDQDLTNIINGMIY